MFPYPNDGDSLQAEDLDVLPGQADLNSDRGSRYVTLHSPERLFLPASR